LNQNPKTKSLESAILSRLLNLVVPRNGVEPLRPLRVTGFSYRYSFHCSRNSGICGLDYTFTVYTEGVSRCPPSSLYTFPANWRDLARYYQFTFVNKASPNLKGSAPQVSPWALKFFLSPACLPIPPPGQFSKKILRLPGKRIVGAEDRARTGHPDLGKVVLYQMSYFRMDTGTLFRFKRTTELCSVE
jgi:hypothetical protein